jgi:hypothetical protein
MPLALIATTTALAYVMGKRRKSASSSKTGVLRRKASARMGQGRTRA